MARPPKKPAGAPDAGSGGLIRVPEVLGLLSNPERNMDALVAHAFSGLGANTLRAYGKAWDDFARFLGVPSRGEAASHLIRAGHGAANAIALSYQDKMRELKLSASTIRTRISALKGITNRLRVIGLINWKLEVRTPKVKALKDTKGPGKPPVLEVIGRLQRTDDVKSIRDLAIIHLIYTCGLRRGELGGLDLEHLDLPHDRVFILGKAREEREPITVPPNAKASLEAWLKARPKDAGTPVFVSLDNASHRKRLSGMSIWRITTSYGLGRPHGVRHTAITEVLDKTNDLRTAQEFSRHKDIRMLQIYDDNRKDRAGKASRLLDEET